MGKNSSGHGGTKAADRDKAARRAIGQQGGPLGSRECSWTADMYRAVGRNRLQQEGRIWKTSCIL